MPRSDHQAGEAAAEFLAGPEIRAAIQGLDAALQSLGIEVPPGSLGRVTLATLTVFEQAGGLEPRARRALRHVIQHYTKPQSE